MQFGFSGLIEIAFVVGRVFLLLLVHSLISLGLVVLINFDLDVNPISHSFPSGIL